MIDEVSVKRFPKSVSEFLFSGFRIIGRSHKELRPIGCISRIGTTASCTGVGFPRGLTRLLSEKHLPHRIEHTLLWHGHCGITLEVKLLTRACFSFITGSNSQPRSSYSSNIVNFLSVIWSSILENELRAGWRRALAKKSNVVYPSAYRATWREGKIYQIVKKGRHIFTEW